MDVPSTLWGGLFFKSCLKRKLAQETNPSLFYNNQSDSGALFLQPYLDDVRSENAEK